MGDTVIAAPVGHGACLRRPDAYTRIQLRFDGEGAVFRDLTGQLVTAYGVTTTQTATGCRFNGKCYYGGAAGSRLILGTTDTRPNLDFLHQLGQNGTSPKWSISFWYRLANTNVADRFIIDTLANSVTRYGINIWISTAWRWYVQIGAGNGAGYVIGYGTGTNSVPQDTDWHYMVFLYDQSLSSSNCRIYCDGTILSPTGSKSAVTPSANTSTYAARMGCIASNGNTYNLIGNVDELTIRTGAWIDGTKVPTRRM